MKKEEIEELKEYLLETEEDIKFKDEYDDVLIGYAERFDNRFMPMYEGINTFLFKTPEESIQQATTLSDSVCEFPGLEESVVGYMILEDGKISLLHDKEKLLNNLAKDYENDGMEIDDEDDSYYSQAYQWYDFNIIGTGLTDMTTPSFACTEEYPLPVASNS